MHLRLPWLLPLPIFTACSAEKEAEAGPCGAILTCDAFSGGSQVGEYAEGSDADLLPDDFPAAPTDATLCGALTYETGTSSVAGLLYYLHTGADADLEAHYEGALASAGYTLGDSVEVEDGVGCHTSAAITGGDLLATAALFIYTVSRAPTRSDRSRPAHKHCALRSSLVVSCGFSSSPSSAPSRPTAPRTDRSTTSPPMRPSSRRRSSPPSTHGWIASSKRRHSKTASCWATVAARAGRVQPC